MESAAASAAAASAAAAAAAAAAASDKPCLSPKALRPYFDFTRGVTRDFFYDQLYVYAAACLPGVGNCLTTRNNAVVRIFT
jgi:hypothetical protein